MRRKVSILLILPVVLSLLVIFIGFLRFGIVTNIEGNHIFVQKKHVLEESSDCQRAQNWMSNKWLVDKKDVQLLLKDDWSWMEVCGFLEVNSFTSATIYVIDPLEGSRKISSFEKWNTPHFENMYLKNEYKPEGETEKYISARFYSKPNFWSANLTGDLAIIQNILWKDNTKEEGTIFAYQRKKPKWINVPIEKGVPRSWYTDSSPI